jgi:hypothetical protein
VILGECWAETSNGLGVELEMSYQKKKELERRYLERVKSRYTAFPSGTLIADEEPDFLVRDAEKNCGIEIVQYVRGQGKGGSRLRWREELHDQIVASAQKKHEARSIITLSVHVHWFHHRELQGRDVEWVSDELSKLVSECESLEINESLAIEPDYRAQINNFITRVSVRRRSSGRNAWSNVEVGPAEADGLELQELISLKNVKMSRYLKKCSEVWLIIVADGQRISSTGELNNRVRQMKFESAFDNVLYFDAEAESVIELLT